MVLNNDNSPVKCVRLSQTANDDNKNLLSRQIKIVAAFSNARSILKNNVTL